LKRHKVLRYIYEAIQGEIDESCLPYGKTPVEAARFMTGKGHPDCYTSTQLAGTSIYSLLSVAQQFPRAERDLEFEKMADTWVEALT